MVHDLVQLVLVHLPLLDDQQSLLFQRIQAGALSISHLSFKLHEFCVLFIDFSLNDFASSVQLSTHNC